MIGLWTKGEFVAVFICVIAEVVALILVVTTAAALVAAVLIVVAAGCQIAVALHFMKRRKARGVWGTDRP